MRRLAAIACSALLAIPALLALDAGAAYADGSAPAPSCDNSGSRFWICDPTAGSAPFTWTVTRVFPLNIGNSTSTSHKDFVSGGCSKGETLTVSYSYVSNGTTFTSASTSFGCNAGPPQ
jgi:hypothetical protein